MKLGIFDLDGTLLLKKKLPPTVREGLRALHKKGVRTTVLTGRGYRSVKKALGEDWKYVISDNLFIGIENSGRITANDGSKNIAYFPLSEKEIRNSFEVLQNYNISFIAYYPKNNGEKPRVWAKDEQIAKTLRLKYKNLGSITQQHIKDFTNKLIYEQPCMISISPDDLNLPKMFPKHINIVFNGDVFNINTAGIHKGTGALHMHNHLGISAQDVLVAGNDENDLKMLHLPVGKKIVVGDTIHHLLSKKHTFLTFSSPEELGIYFRDVA